MEANIAIIVYLLSFRLAVILAGVAAIYMGYKLFVLGVYENRNKGNDEISASAGSVSVKLVNVAPGSTFALFGAALIVTMLLNSPPQVSTNSNSAEYRGASSPARSQESDQTSNDCLKDAPESAGVDRIENCWQKRAVDLNDQAWYLFEQKADPTLAIQLISLAIAASPKDTHITDFQDTLSRLEGMNTARKN